MFAMYDDGSGRKRRKMGPGTVAVSIFAHAAVAGALLGFARQADAKPAREEVIAEWNLDPKPTPPPPPPPRIEQPPAPKVEPKHEDAPKLETPRETPPPPPVKGDFVTPRPPEHPPASIPAPDPNAKPITVADVTGVGKEGDVVGKVDPGDDRAPTGNTTPAPPAPPAPPAEPKHEDPPPSSEPMDVSAVDVRPELRNSDDVARALERDYPSQLRDAGVTGETMLQFVVNEDGRVEPGTVEVVSSSDDGFSAAARRVVTAMRFTPAKSGGRNVKVTITMPVHWNIQG